MKKQYQIVMAMLVTAVFFCTNKHDNLKACGSNTTACATIQSNQLKKTVVTKKDGPGGAYQEETDGGIYRYMNPFLQ